MYNTPIYQLIPVFLQRFAYDCIVCTSFSIFNYRSLTNIRNMVRYSARLHILNYKDPER